MEKKLQVEGEENKWGAKELNMTTENLVKR